MSELASGERLRIRLFVERIEVPVIAATIVATEGAGAIAQIEIVPTDRALTFPPRTTVHLFFLDYQEFERTDGRDLGDGIKHASLIPQGGEYQLDQFYKLLFMGEMFSSTMVKSGAGSRSLVLQCVDFSNYWDTAYMYQLRYAQDPNVISGNTQTFAQGSDNDAYNDLPTGDILSNVAMMATSLTPSPVQSPAVSNVGSMLGGLFSILELVGGVPNLYSGLNAWFTVAERRARLMDQVGSDNGETAKNLFNAEVFTSFVKNELGEMGDVISFRDIINVVNRLIYYAVVPNPAGTYFAGSRDPLTVATTTTAAGAASPDEALDQLALLDAGSNLSPVSSEPGPRKFGVRWHPIKLKYVLHAGWDYPVAEGTPVSATRAGTVVFAGDTSADAGIAVKIRHGGTSDGNAEGFTSTYMHLSEVSVTVGERVEAGDAIGLSGNTGGSTGPHLHFEIRFNGTPVDPLDWFESLGGSTAVEDIESTVLDAGVASAPSTRERLVTQIFRPDIWFAAPPLCNIVFPEEYSAFSYTRQHMREVTRLQLDTFDQLIDDGAQNSVLKQVYFAPVFSEESGKESLSEGGIGSASKALIYDHELMSGIIPRIERISDLSFFSVSGQADVDLAQQTEDVVARATAYGAQAAAFNFFRHRYAARSISLGGRFLPRLVPGLPIVVVSRPVDVAGVAPTHFLGMLVSITHTITQGEGGTTSMNVAYARPHKPDEADQFIKDLKLLRPSQKEISTTVVPGDDAPSNQAYIISWIDAQVTKLKKAGTLNPTNIGTIPNGLKGPNGYQVLRIESLDPTPATADLEEVASFSSAVVVEDSKGELLSLEDAIRPAWISADYSNSNIGTKFYRNLIDCSAVVDVVDLAELKKVAGNEDLTAVSIEAAINKVVSDYSLVTQGGSVTGAGFIWQLTKRGYSTMAQTLGEGSGEDKTTWGFHKYVSGRYESLEGLNLDVALSPKPEALKSDKSTEEATPQRVSTRLDTRKARYDIVLAYRNELVSDRGLRG